jgi:hypothetical protein
MIVDGVLILYTSSPNCPQMRAWAARLEAAGQPVFLAPLSKLPQKKKVAITPALIQTLPLVQPN